MLKLAEAADRLSCTFMKNLVPKLQCTLWALYGYCKPLKFVLPAAVSQTKVCSLLSSWHDLRRNHFTRTGILLDVLKPEFKAFRMSSILDNWRATKAFRDSAVSWRWHTCSHFFPTLGIVFSILQKIQNYYKSAFIGGFTGPLLPADVSLKVCNLMRILIS